MTVKLHPGKDDYFLDRLGVAYAWLEVNGRRYPLPIVSEDELPFIRKAVEQQNLLTPNNAAELVRTMTETRLVPEFTDVIEAIRSYRLARPFDPFRRFEICAKCTSPVRHGHVVTRNKERVTKSLYNVLQGFMVCDRMVRDGRIYVDEAIGIVQTMRCEGIPIDHGATLDAFLDALPKAVRRQAESQGDLVAISIGAFLSETTFDPYFKK